MVFWKVLYFSRIVKKSNIRNICFCKLCMMWVYLFIRYFRNIYVLIIR